MQNSTKKKKNKGFTLIEALVAITILTVSIAGPITIASRGMASAVFARDQITAFYLAQEAIEFIRNKRDENNLKGNGWTDGLEDCLDGKVCVIDSKNNEINECIGDICPVLKYNDNTAFYSYDSGEDSSFIREIRIVNVNIKEIAITTTLSWSSGSVSKSFTVKEHILDW
jgi:prepilin-type N-terminal cleavage/methylation domain-containing protein